MLIQINHNDGFISRYVQRLIGVLSLKPPSLYFFPLMKTLLKIKGIEAEDNTIFTCSALLYSFKLK